MRLEPTALVPIRTGPVAKRRLAHVLGPKERTELVVRLFDHVVEVLERAGLRVIALSPAPFDADVEVWTDERKGLNGAIGAALVRLGPNVLVVHADLPALTVADVEAVLASPADVVVARAHDGGTNGLLLRELISPAFGPRSALVHAQRARAAGLRTHVVDLSGFRVDTDDESTLSAAGPRRRR
jgi:2-phospho-L-lactate/phosphoenolpyruvate guanylyltransferase